MNKFYVFIVFLSGMLCFSVNAASSSGAVSLENVRFQLISTGTASVYVYDVPVEGGCEHTIPVLLFEGDNANLLADQIYATLMMAKASGRKVNIQTIGCWDRFSTPVITSMYLHD